MSSPCSVNKDERVKMRQYWGVFKPSIESMMLDQNAKYMQENEQNEILSCLPDFTGKRVLELGAGIGRFSSELARLASHVTTVDFMDSFVAQSKEANRDFDNIKFLCADVMKLEFADCSFDLVFSNWLLMYLTEQEVAELMASILNWLEPEGYLFFRESCYHQSGNIPRPENPTKYRTPLHYIKSLAASAPGTHRMAVKLVKNLLTPLQYYGNATQVALMAQKVEESIHYSTKICEISISRIESLTYRNRKNSNSELIDFFCKKFEKFFPRPCAKRVMEICCGGGENSVMIAERIGCCVLGVDSFPENIHLAIERQDKIPIPLRKQLQYEARDWRSRMSLHQKVDAVVCLDFLLEKRDLFDIIRRSKEWLQSDGYLLMATLLNNTENIISNDGYITKTQLTAEMVKCGFSFYEIDEINGSGFKTVEFTNSIIRASCDVFQNSELQTVLKRVRRKSENMLKKECQHVTVMGKLTTNQRL